MEKIDVLHNYLQMAKKNELLLAILALLVRFAMFFPSSSASHSKEIKT
jgi:hypothetical protein